MDITYNNKELLGSLMQSLIQTLLISQLHTLLKRLRPVVVSTLAPVLRLSQPENTAAPSSSSGASTVRRHVMISYAWGAKKELAVALAAELRSLCYEVWRDEEGSAIVPSMSGDTDERMAQAIEASHAVIVCVSPQYKESVNCRSEAQYCKGRRKSHGLQLLYVMMDNEYTSVSKTTVDGWLGFMLGTELWYPLWSPGNVQSTAIELGKLIGDNAKSDGSSAPASPVASVSSPAVVSSPPPTSGPNYASAWALLSDPTKVLIHTLLLYQYILFYATTHLPTLLTHHVGIVLCILAHVMSSYFTLLCHLTLLHLTHCDLTLFR